MSLSFVPSGMGVGVSKSGAQDFPWLKTLAGPMWVGAGVAFAMVHFVSANAVGLEIFRRLGGFTDIGGGWTAIGGVERSWTPVAWLPAGVMFFLADWLHLDGLAGAGLILVLCGSFAAAPLLRQCCPLPFASCPNAVSACTPGSSGFRWPSGSGGSRCRSI